ncbi:MAG TPA: hypothetical protein VE035_01835 [Puia sp.]|nr:hypothetical protein [Puia sp.]
MKTVFDSKKTLMSLFLAASLGLALASCKKDSAASSDAVTVDDAADAITQAVVPETSGVVGQTQTAVVIINTNNLSCGVSSDTSIAGQSLPGAAITYSYSLKWSNMLSCTNGIPQQLSFGFSGKSSYDAPRISSSDSSNATATATGLQPSSSKYVFNQTYTWKGSKISKVRNKHSFSSTITITTSDLTVDKSSQQIVSGTASVTISGAGSGGSAFSYSGTLTFSGNKQAVLVLGNGNTYTILWS